MSSFLHKVKNYFNFNRIERRGIVVLLFILIVLLLINIFIPYILKENDLDFSDFEMEVRAFEESQKRIGDSLNSIHKNYKPNIDNLSPFPFDPNDLPTSKWKKIGLSDRQISIIKNYESKGGQFYKKSDLKKIYGISKEEFDILEPYIQIKKFDYRKPDPEDAELAEIVAYPFDPNALTKDEWLSMGLRENLVQTIINYRNKGGKFYEKEDLKNIYGMDEGEYIALEPYIVIKKDTSNYHQKSRIAKNLLLDINSADTLDLQQLKGIGPSYARRIIKYREKLGGYAFIDQLFEVYGMDTLRFKGIVDNIYVETDSIHKININEAGIKKMIRHPYFEFYLAKSIVTYREEIKIYTDLKQIKKANLIYEELYQKILPYICL